MEWCWSNISFNIIFREDDDDDDNVVKSSLRRIPINIYNATTPKL